MKYLVILPFLFVSASLWAQLEKENNLTELEIEMQAKIELHLLTENFEISQIKEDQLLSFLKHKIKFFNKHSLSTKQRNSIVNGRFSRRLLNILNQNENGEPFSLDEDLLRQLNLHEIKEF